MSCLRLNKVIKLHSTDVQDVNLLNQQLNLVSSSGGHYFKLSVIAAITDKYITCRSRYYTNTLIDDWGRIRRTEFWH